MSSLLHNHLPELAHRMRESVDNIIDGDYPDSVRLVALTTLAVGAAGMAFGVEAPLHVAAESGNERVAAAASKISEILGIGE